MLDARCSMLDVGWSTMHDAGFHSPDPVSGVGGGREDEIRERWKRGLGAEVACQSLLPPTQGRGRPAESFEVTPPRPVDSGVPNSKSNDPRQTTSNQHPASACQKRIPAELRTNSQKTLTH